MGIRLVRRGREVRLKAPEGTFSYYHPAHLFTGFGWDTQSASVFLVKQPIRRILILGLGGGTAARQCRALFPEAQIVGVEINSQVLEMAHDYFGLASLSIIPVNAPGETYLKKARSKFDAIIDDMWPPQPGSPRAWHTQPSWIDLIKSRLNRGGVYALNLFSRRERPDHFSIAVERLGSRFSSLREVRPIFGQTTLVAAGSDLHTPREVRAKLRRLPEPMAAKLRQVKFLSLDKTAKEVR
jgi:spermidine synthase